MPMYRKKPVVIEAIRFTGANWRVILEWFDDPAVGYSVERDDGQHIMIHTLEGAMTANAGDWIIKGVNGEFYPCKPDIFKKTYDLVQQ